MEQLVWRNLQSLAQGHTHLMTFGASTQTQVCLTAESTFLPTVLTSWAAATKYPRLSGSSRNELPHGSGGWMSELRVSAGRLPLEHSVGGRVSVPLSPLAAGGLLAMVGIPWLTGTSPHLCLHPHMAFSLCVHLYVQISPFYIKGHQPYWTEAHLTTCS